MNVLVIDTSNNVLGVAVMKNEQLIGKITTNLQRNHSTRLMPAVNQLMKDVDLKVEELNQIAVAQGPGSYTGLRIGLTTAKTLAWALEIPIVGVSSLEALAYQGQFFEGIVCPFFDARRSRVYTGIYQWENETLQMLEADRNVVFVDILEDLKERKERVLFLSPDIHVFEEEIKNQLGELAVIPAGPYHIPDPSHLGLASLTKEHQVTHEITPNYLRLAEAESNWINQQKENKNND